MNPVVLGILDGIGLRSASNGNAVQAASTPTLSPLLDNAAALAASGPVVGLPYGQAGNSEVGHLTIGAGRSIPQPLTRINQTIEHDELEDTLEPLLQNAEDQVHIIGLLSDGGVHSHHHHIHAVADTLQDNNIRPVIHVISDGRDTPPQQLQQYLDALDDVLTNGVVASVSGRYYAMDRDDNYDRTRAAVEAIQGTGEHRTATPTRAREAAYQRGETDEFITPTVIENTPTLTEGEPVFCCNFRADRMRQLVRMLAATNPVTTMTAYEAGVETTALFEPRYPEQTLGECVAQAGYRQLRVSESEKQAHVTYFFNGGRDASFDGEERVIHSSPDVETYDLSPSMRAAAITETVTDALRRDDPPAFILATYANADMLGHTGDVDATAESIEALDSAVANLLTVAEAQGATVLLTADHGNAERMRSEGQTITAHTRAPVPFAVGAGSYEVNRRTGTLHDVAPSVLDALDIEVPAVMDGSSLLTEIE